MKLQLSRVWPSTGRSSTGNNQADKLAKRAVDGIETWNLEAFLEDEPEIVVQIEQVVNVCQVQGTQKPEVCDFYPTEPDSDLVEAQHCQDDQIFGWAKSFQWVAGYV